jgi:uncharacterized membrane-anchored protein
VSNRLTWLALALPLAAITLAVARAELFLHRAQEFSFPIQGYDPRDLLQGHYIQFRLTLDTAHDADECAQDACCLCLTRAHGQPVPSTAVTTCAQAHVRCESALPLEAAERSWRFYVAEGQARDIERALRDAHELGRAFAVLAIEPAGGARVSGLQLDGQRYGSGISGSK